MIEKGTLREVKHSENVEEMEKEKGGQKKRGLVEVRSANSSEFAVGSQGKGQLWLGGGSLGLSRKSSVVKLQKLERRVGRRMGKKVWALGRSGPAVSQRGEGWGMRHSHRNRRPKKFTGKWLPLKRERRWSRWRKKKMNLRNLSKKSIGGTALSSPVKERGVRGRRYTDLGTSVKSLVHWQSSGTCRKTSASVVSQGKKKMVGSGISKVSRRRQGQQDQGFDPASDSVKRMSGRHRRVQGKQRRRGQRRKGLRGLSGRGLTKLTKLTKRKKGAKSSVEVRKPTKGIRVRSVTDVSGDAHNGCRGKKQRRK